MAYLKHTATQRFGTAPPAIKPKKPGIIMSTQMNTLPASAAVDMVAGTSLATLVKDLWRRFVAAWREELRLRRTLREIEGLSDRELTDIGLASGEIHRLRHGDVFEPMNWSIREDGK